jgi:hypothetical protein
LVKFLDGPAGGKALMLRRTPIYLRVVQSRGEFDALDQLTDTPAKDETITVYKRRDDLPMRKYHILCRRRRNGGTPSGWYFEASYSVLADQPEDSEVRSNEAWQAWATRATKQGAK